MKKSTIKILAVMLTLVFTLSLVGCGSTAPSADKPAADTKAETKAENTAAKQDAPVTLKMYVQYADDNEKIPFDYFEKALKEAKPNITIEKVLRGKDDTQLLTLAASGEVPDIFQVNPGIIKIFLESKNILPLDQYVSKFQFDAKMLKSAGNTLKYTDGHVYGFPFIGNDMYTWFYNKKIFADNNVAVPTTYPELLAAVKTFKDKGITPIAMMGKVEFAGLCLLDAFATRIDADGVKKFDTFSTKATDPQWKYASEKVIELAKAGAFQKGCATVDYPEANAMFTSGKAAMFMNGQWDGGGIAEKLKDDVDFMVYPTSPDKDTYEKTKNRLVGGGGVNGYGVSSKTKNPELAAFVAQLAALKVAEARYVKLGNVVVPTKIDMQPEKPLSAISKKISDTIGTAESNTFFNWNFNNAPVADALKEACTALLTGSYSAEQWAKDVDANIEKAKK